MSRLVFVNELHLLACRGMIAVPRLSSVVDVAWTPWTLRDIMALEGPISPSNHIF